ncbi:PREDICTED: kinesin-related protein 4-like isoform X2 [Nicrophorus vespilloides]|uniref:Kinesin-related protein 4-like isoform X2 n=1 Tax=Nicrophorus vespilloides TaxID=110193 RepID=A0ABM1MNL1_NICVS|nr:PREDICTED: kinesin-related protein 4-like isoform X2 [Nicrophorus vespilloides]
MPNKMIVAMRLRPLVNNAVLKEHKPSIYIYNGNVFTEVERCKYAEKVLYDHLFIDTDDNKKVYETVKPMVESFIHGTNGTVFVYGQQNSGKNHTLYGTCLDVGIVYLMLNEVTSHISLNEDIEYTLKVAFVEVAEDDKLLDLQDVVSKACAKKGLQFTNDLKDLLERGRFMYKSHNHVILSFNLQYNIPNENKSFDSQFNFVILADPTGKDTDKDHNHFTLSLLFTYLHALSINDTQIDVDKMLLSSVLSKAVGDFGKSLFIGTLSPTDAKNSLYTIKKIKLIKDPEFKNVRVSDYSNQLSGILLKKFKVNEASRECDYDDMEDEDSDYDEKDFVTRLDVSQRVYITEIPPQYYRQLNSIGLLITNDQTHEISSFFISHKNDKIGTSLVAYLPDNLLPTKINNDAALYDNEQFIKICKEEHILQVYLNKLRGIYPLDPENQMDFDLQELLSDQNKDPPTEQQIENEFEYVAGVSAPNEDPEISGIEFKYIDTPRTDYGSEAECSTSQYVQSYELYDIDFSPSEDVYVNSECKGHILQIQHLLKKIEVHEENSRQLQSENIKMKDQLEEQRKRNMELFDHIRHIKSTLYSIVNKEVYKAKYIYKSNIKVYDKFYKHELDTLRRMFIQAQQLAKVTLKNSQEPSKSVNTHEDKGETANQAGQGTSTAKVVKRENGDERENRRIEILDIYFKQIETIKKKISCHIDNMENHLKMAVLIDCKFCKENNECFTAEEGYLYKQNKSLHLILNKANIILNRNVIYFRKIQNRNKTLVADNNKMKVNLNLLNDIGKCLKDNHKFDSKSTLYPVHNMFYKRLIVKTSLDNMEEIESEILNDMSSKGNDAMESDLLEEESISKKLSDMHLPRTPMDSSFNSRVHGLVNSAIVMEKLLSAINVLYNNMHRFLSKRDDCDICRRFADMLHYKIIQLVSLKSQYSFWSKNITMEDTSIDLYLNITSELLEMTNTLRESQRLKLIQYKLMQRKVYFENCMTQLVNKRSYVDNVLTLLIGASSEFQDILKMEGGNIENCEYGMFNILISLLFSHVRERIIVTLFYLDNMESLLQHDRIKTRINELDISIARNEKFLKDIFPANKDLPDLKTIEVEHAYLIALYNAKLLKMLALENRLKLTPQQHATQFPKELGLGPLQSGMNPSPYVTELSVNTFEPPTEIPICTEILRAKHLINSSEAIESSSSTFHPQHVLNNVTPDEYALRMLGSIEQIAVIAAPLPIEHKSPPDTHVRMPAQCNPRKRPFVTTDTDQVQHTPYRYPIPSTSQAIVPPPLLQPPANFGMPFRGPGPALPHKVQFKPKYQLPGPSETKPPTSAPTSPKKSEESASEEGSSEDENEEVVEQPQTAGRTSAALQYSLLVEGLALNKPNMPSGHCQEQQQHAQSPTESISPRELVIDEDPGSSDSNDEL